MAVAWSSTKLGRATIDVTVRDPVVLTATLPRFLLNGDRGTMSFDLDNVEGAAGDYTINVKTTGPVKVTGNPPPRSSSPPSSGPRCRWRSMPAAPAPPISTSTSRGRTGCAGAALRARRQGGDADPGAPLDPDAGQGREPDADVGHVLRSGVGHRQRVAVGQPVDRARCGDHPQGARSLSHGCSEQITSRAMPLLYVNDLAAGAHLAMDTAVDQRIKDAIERLLARQGSNGSFGLWSAGGDDAWLDAYVTDFLTRAREKGFAVPDVLFKSALDRIRNSVVNANEPEKDGGRDLAYGLYVLARNGAAPIGDLRYLADTKLEQSRDADCQIAARGGAGAGRRQGEGRAGLWRGARCAGAKARARVRPGRLRLSAARCGGAGLARQRRQRAAGDADAGGAAGRSGAGLTPYTSTQETPGWCWPRARWRRRRWRSISTDRRSRPRSIAATRPRDGRQAGQDHQHRRCAGAGGGLGLGFAGHAGARGLERLQDRAQLLHARRQAGRYQQGQAERSLRGGAEDHRGQAGIRAHHGADYLPAGLEIDNPHLVSSGDTGTLDWIEDGEEPEIPSSATTASPRRSIAPATTRRCSRSPMSCARYRPANTCCRRPMSRTCTTPRATAAPAPARSRCVRRNERDGKSSLVMTIAPPCAGLVPIHDFCCAQGTWRPGSARMTAAAICVRRAG
jgi:hypothetical protein